MEPISIIKIIMPSSLGHLIKKRPSYMGPKMASRFLSLMSFFVLDSNFSLELFCRKNTFNNIQEKYVIHLMGFFCIFYSTLMFLVYLNRYFYTTEGKNLYDITKIAWKSWKNIGKRWIYQKPKYIFYFVSFYWSSKHNTLKK